MASEWEELEKLTKEELIIELVRANYRYKVFKGHVERLGAAGADGYFDDDYEAPTTEEWARRIAMYVVKKVGDHADSWDMCRYGVDEDTAEAIFEKLYDEGVVKRPESD